MSSEESDYEFDYEVLSEGSAEPFDDTGREDLSFSGSSTARDIGESSHQGGSLTESHTSNGTVCDNKELKPRALNVVEESAPNAEEISKDTQQSSAEMNKDTEAESEDKHLDFEDLDQLMSEIGNMRSSMRLMPDFQRREMAAQLALKMAAMFGGLSDDEVEDTRLVN